MKLNDDYDVVFNFERIQMRRVQHRIGESIRNQIDRDLIETIRMVARTPLNNNYVSRYNTYTHKKNKKGKRR